jgi:DNA end-binding protein Ku
VEVTKDNVISFTEAEMDNIPLKSAKTIDIDRFVEASDITPVMLEEAYYVLPDEAIGAKAYEWFVKGLKREHKVAIGKVCLRQREHICVISPMGNGLVLNTMFYADEVREMPQPPKAQVTDGEVDLICQVIGKFSKPFEHTAYTDEYTQVIQSMIDAKLKGEKIQVVAEAKQPSQDLESALRSMLNK